MLGGKKTRAGRSEVDGSKVLVSVVVVVSLGTEQLGRRGIENPELDGI